MHRIRLALDTLKRELQPTGLAIRVGVQPSGCPLISPARKSSAWPSSKKVKTCNSILALAACAWLAGCVSTRSISNSDYREPGRASLASPAGHSDANFVYRGELSEFDGLGIV